MSIPVSTGRSAGPLAAVALLAGVVWSVLGPAGAAAAHAVLVTMSPPPGALLDAVPERVMIEFNEPVRVDDRSLVVIDSSGTVVSTPPEVDGAAVSVQVPASARGWHAVSWRVVSADGHPLSGAWTFRIGEGSAEAPSNLEDRAAASARSSTGARWSWLGGQVVSGVGAAVLTGTLFLAVLGLRREVAARIGLAAAAGVVAIVGSLAASASNEPYSAGGNAVGELFAGPASGAYLVRSALAMAVTGAVVALGTSSRVVAWPAWVGAAAALVAVPAFAGHAPAESGLARVAVAGHLVVAACWLGAVPALWHVARHGSAGTGVLLRRFSLAAGRLLAATVALGSLLAYVLSGGPDQVNPRWGWLLVLKLALVAVAAAAGAWTRAHVPAVTHVAARSVGSARAAARFGPADPADPADPTDDEEAPDGEAAGGGSHVGRSLAVEVVALVAIVATSVAMTYKGPPREPELGPALVDVQATDDVRVQLVVDPARAGSNWVHLYTLDAAGLPVEVEDVSLSFASAEHGIAAIPQLLSHAGNGHRLTVTDDLGLPGTWEVAITVRTDRFTEAEAPPPSRSRVEAG